MYQNNFSDPTQYQPMFHSFSVADSMNNIDAINSYQLETQNTSDQFSVNYNESNSVENLVENYIENVVSGEVDSLDLDTEDDLLGALDPQGLDSMKALDSKYSQPSSSDDWEDEATTQQESWLAKVGNYSA